MSCTPAHSPNEPPRPGPETRQLKQRRAAQIRHHLIDLPERLKEQEARLAEAEARIAEAEVRRAEAEARLEALEGRGRPAGP